MYSINILYQYSLAKLRITLELRDFLVSRSAPAQAAWAVSDHPKIVDSHTN